MKLESTPNTRFPRRDKRKQETRGRIVDAAKQLFALLGYEDATIAAIAEAADVHVTTLFTHFKNKRELVEALVEVKLEFLQNAVSASKGRVPFLDFFRELVQRAAALYDKDAAHQIDFGLLLRKDPGMLPVWLHYERSQIALFSEYIAADFGLDTAVDRRPLLVAAMLVTGNILSYENWLEHGESTTLTEQAMGTFAAVETLLGPQLATLSHPLQQ